jgi:hypothetical protein
MREIDFDLYFTRFTYYEYALIGIAIAGLVGFFMLSKSAKEKTTIRIALGIVVLIAFYESLGAVLGSQKIPNLWVYNLFNSHVAAILFFLLIKSFLKRKNHQRIVDILIAIFLVISLVSHLIGFVRYDDGGEYMAFLNSVVILCCCSLYFIELITLDEFLGIDPLREFSFWAATAVLFYFSSSFIIFISFTYLYTHHLEIYFMVIEVPRLMAILCNLLLCFGIYSVLIRERFKVELLHV